MLIDKSKIIPERNNKSLLIYGAKVSLFAVPFWIPITIVMAMQTSWFFLLFLPLCPVMCSLIYFPIFYRIKSYQKKHHVKLLTLFEKDDSSFTKLNASVLKYSVTDKILDRTPIYVCHVWIKFDDGKKRAITMPFKPNIGEVGTYIFLNKKNIFGMTYREEFFIPQTAFLQMERKAA